MCFCWKEFNEISDFLISNRDSEASFRTCVGRSYYAAHKTACDFLCQSGRLSGKEEKIHETVIRQFIDSKQTNAKKIASFLQRLKEKRVKADYHSDIKITKEDAKLSLSWSGFFFEELRKLGNAKF